MNKLVLVILVTVILGVGGFFVLGQTQTSPQEPTPIGNQQTPSNTSRYQHYSPDVFNNAANQRRVLFFYASWCPTCRPADANFQANLANIPQDVVVIRVNYNDPDTDQNERDLAQKYGVTYQHTYVQIDENGNEVAKWNGGSIDELLANIK